MTMMMKMMESSTCRPSNTSSFDDDNDDDNDNDDHRRVWTISVTIISDIIVDRQRENAASFTTHWNFVGVVRRPVVVVAASLGLGFNSFVLLAIVASRKLRGKAAHVLGSHLAAVDIVCCALVLLFETVSEVVGGCSGEGSLCLAYAFGRALLCHVTVWTVASLGWEKYRTIASPMRRRSAAAELLPVSVGLATVWTSGLVVATLRFLFCDGESLFRSNDSSFQLSSVSNATLAQPLGGGWWRFVDACQSTSARWYLLVLSVDTFCLPLTVLAYCYWRIFRIARWQKRRIAVMAAMVRVITLSAGVPIARENARRRTSDQTTTTTTTATGGRKALRTVCVFLGAFLVCYAPYGLTSLVGYFRGGDGVRLNPLPVALADLVLMTSPTVNAFVYGLRNRTLKQCLRNCLRRNCAHYSLKFPRLHAAILRYFGSPNKAMDRRVKNPPFGGGGGGGGEVSGGWPRLVLAPPYGDDDPGTPEDEAASDRRPSSRVDRLLVFTEIEPDRRGSKSQMKYCAASNSGSSYLISSRNSLKNHTQRRPPLHHYSEHVKTNRSMLISWPDLQTKPSRSKERPRPHFAKGPVALNSTKALSKKATSGQNVELTSVPGLAWKCELPTKLVEGNSRIVVGVDVHAMLRSPSNSL